MSNEELLKRLKDELDRIPPEDVDHRVQLLDMMIRAKNYAARPTLPASKKDRAFFENLFKLRSAVGDQGTRMSQVRQILKEACLACYEKVPESAEATLGIRAMHLAMMHFNSAIMLNEGGPAV